MLHKPHDRWATGYVASSAFAHWGDGATDVTGKEARWQRDQRRAWQNGIFVPKTAQNAKAELLRLLNNPPAPTSVLYIFCQCAGQPNNPMLRFGNTNRASTPASRRQFTLSPLVRSSNRAIPGQHMVTCRPFSESCTPAHECLVDSERSVARRLRMILRKLCICSIINSIALFAVNLRPTSDASITTLKGRRS
jgi:hypothetical protein